MSSKDVKDLTSSKKSATLVKYGYPMYSLPSYGLVHRGKLVSHSHNIEDVKKFAEENGYVIKKYKGFNKG